MPYNHSFAGTIGSNYRCLNGKDIDSLLKDYVAQGLVKKDNIAIIYQANLDRYTDIRKIFSGGLGNLTPKNHPTTKFKN